MSADCRKISYELLSMGFSGVIWVSGNAQKSDKKWQKVTKSIYLPMPENKKSFLPEASQTVTNTAFRSGGIDGTRTRDLRRDRPAL